MSFVSEAARIVVTRQNSAADFPTDAGPYAATGPANPAATS